MDLGITQKEVARRMGADQWTVINWEKDRTQIAVRFVPVVIEFLSYDPFPKGDTFPDRLRAARRALGLSQAGLARRLEVDESTVQKWEKGRATPPVQCWPGILEVIGPEPTPDAPLPDLL